MMCLISTMSGCFSARSSLTSRRIRVASWERAEGAGAPPRWALGQAVGSRGRGSRRGPAGEELHASAGARGLGAPTRARRRR